MHLRARHGRRERDSLERPRGIEWPRTPAIVSEQDQKAPTLAEWLADPRSRSFTFQG